MTLKSNIGFVSVILSLIAFVFMAVAIAVKDWISVSVLQYSDDPMKMWNKEKEFKEYRRSGLWKFCMSSMNKLICINISDIGVSSKHRACQGLAVMGAVLCLVGLAAVLLSTIHKSMPRLTADKALLLIKAAIALLIAAGVFTIIADAIFASDATTNLTDEYKVGFLYGWILSVVGGLMCIAAGCIAVIAARQIQQRPATTTLRSVMGLSDD